MDSAHPGASKSAFDEHLERLNSLSSDDLSTWIGFLSIYGRQGVPLRELIMLVSALYSPLAEFWRYSHWSPSGERDYVDPLPADVFLLALLEEASRPEELIAIEQKLVSLGAMVVDNLGQRDSINTNQDWIIDGRSWCAGPNAVSDKVNAKRVSQGLLVLYSQIPDRDVHLLAERQRETFYYHAHAAIVYIFRMVQDKKAVLNDIEELFCDVTLSVLSHRYQPGDEKIVGSVYEYLTRGNFGLAVTPEVPVRLPKEWKRVNQLLLYLQVIYKATASQHEYQRGSLEIELLLEESMDFLHAAVSKRYWAGTKAWGMIGYALAELMATIEDFHGKRTLERPRGLAVIWCNKSLKSGTSIELAALSCVLVGLRDFHELDRLPEKNHLSCGYYLARAGYLELAERFLVSGLHYHKHQTSNALLWRYHLELWTVRMRLGKWEDAERWLSRTSQRLMKRTDVVPAGRFDLWIRSGELGELKLNLASLLSDCHIARGELLLARKTIGAAIGNVGLMRSNYISMTRIALTSRLLNVHLQLRFFDEAAITSMQLCAELQDPGILCFGSQTLCWTVQETLGCANQLVHERMYRKAFCIFHALEGLSKKGPKVPHQSPRTFTGPLPDDLCAYIDRRCNEVKVVLEAFDMAWLRGRAYPGGPLTEFTIDSAPSEMISSGNQARITDLRPSTQESGSELEERLTASPAAASRTGAETVTIKEHSSPAAVDPEHSQAARDKESLLWLIDSKTWRRIKL